MVAAPSSDNFLLEFASLTVALGAGVIAWLQWRAMRQQKWIELFDRRYELYRQIGAAVSECAMEGVVTESAKDTFREAAHLGPILFGKGSQYLFEKLWEASYWREDGLKPRSWPRVQPGEPAEPHHLVAGGWAELKPKMLAALERWQ